VVRVEDSNELGSEISIAAAVVLLVQGMVIARSSMGCGGGRVIVLNDGQRCCILLQKSALFGLCVENPGTVGLERSDNLFL